MKIILSNAHTSYAPGASSTMGGSLYTEYAVSTQINRTIKLFLTNEKIDNLIIDASHITPYNKSLKYKADTINAEQQECLVVETHLNAAPTTVLASYSSGLEVLYKQGNNVGLVFAQTMVEELKWHVPFKIRREGTELYPQKNLYLLNIVKFPIIFIELFFITNPKECLFLVQPRAIDVVAKGIYNGLISYNKKRETING
jgi:N-acetylmuramoyl-L-alanine amidase